MRKSLSFVAIAMLAFVAMSTPVNAKDFTDKLNAIEDAKLRRTLSNSIAIGLITTDEELQAAISQSIDAREEEGYISYSTSTTNKKNTNTRKKPNNNNKPNNNGNGNNKPNNSGNSALAAKITSLSKNLKSLDQAASVKVQKTEGGNKYGAKLFKDITTPIPAAYDRCVKLCELFDPHTNTPEMNQHGKAIKEFFYSIKDDPCVKEALKVLEKLVLVLVLNTLSLEK